MSIAAKPARKQSAEPEVLDVFKIRRRAGTRGCTQEFFAENLNVPASTVRNWEQHRRSPTGPAKVLLRMLAHDAAGVFAIINAAKRNTSAA